jgi:type VI secretion system secreted protein VgrG
MAPEKKANESQFYLMVGNLGAETFYVKRFFCTDEISCLYTVTLEVESADGLIAPDQVLNKPSTLFIFREGGQYFPYSGVITEFYYTGQKFDQTQYRAVLQPKLSQLDYIHQTRIFQKKNLPDIIKDVLDKAQLSNYYKFQLQQTYPVQEYVLQYQESDFNFISRLMESVGIWYFFKEPDVAASQVKPGGSTESLIITDKAASFLPIAGDPKVLFRDPSGLVDRDSAGVRESVHSIGYQHSVVPQEVVLKNYNYRTPETQLTGKNKVKNGVAGSVYEYGGSFKNVSEAQRAAEVTANRIASRQILVAGESNCRALRAGLRFTLAEHNRQDLNADYVLTRVSHAGGHEGDDFTYVNTFQSFPGDRGSSFAPQLRAIVPKVNGVLTAKVEANGSQYAAIDDTGRYKVRMPFDQSSTNNSEGSKYLRVAQPYAGAKYGMHFPVHEGAEMVWACIDGDPNKPIGLGSVPNANTTSPVVGANKVQSVIRTAGGNEIVLDDTDKKQKLHIKTSADNIMSFDDQHKNIAITTTDGNGLLLDDKNEKCVWNADSHTIVMDYKNKKVVITTGGGHTVEIDDKNKKMTLQTTGGHVVQMDDNSKKISLADGANKNTVVLDGNKGLILDSKGTIDITAAQDLTIKGMNVKIEAQQALNGKGTKEAKIEGLDVTVDGTKSVTVKAGATAEISSSASTTLKSSMAVSVEGATTAIKGSMMTNITGTMVKIN